jgi:hypothetical protein
MPADDAALIRAPGRLARGTAASGERFVVVRFRMKSTATDGYDDSRWGTP